VRELSNLIERLAVLHPQAEVSAADLPQRYRQNLPAIPPPIPQPVPAVDEEPAETVEQVLAAVGAGGIVVPPPVVAVLTEGHAPLPPHGVNLKDYIENIELTLIRQALEQSSGVVAHAAKLLNTRRTTLVEKLRKYGLQREEVGEGSDNGL
jgi:sigma-54 specific flagellar transcriptional regulator A